LYDDEFFGRVNAVVDQLGFTYIYACKSSIKGELNDNHLIYKLNSSSYEIVSTYNKKTNLNKYYGSLSYDTANSLLCITFTNSYLVFDTSISLIKIEYFNLKKFNYKHNGQFLYRTDGRYLYIFNSNEKNLQIKSLGGIPNAQFHTKEFLMLDSCVMAILQIELFAERDAAFQLVILNLKNNETSEVTFDFSISSDSLIATDKSNSIFIFDKHSKELHRLQM